MNIIIIAHSKSDYVPNPMGDNYLKYSFDGDKEIVSGTIKWLETILFCTKEQLIKDGKVKGERRVMYTAERPGIMAKSREKIPEKMAMDWEEFTKEYVKAMKGGKDV